jgi:hypothetical protein
MIISPLGQFGLWAPSSGVRDVFTSGMYVFTYPPVIEEWAHPRYGHERRGSSCVEKSGSHCTKYVESRSDVCVGS